MTRTTRAITGCAMSLAAAFAFADVASAAALAEPTKKQLNYCGLYGKTRKLGRTHIKCCTKRYCITCNITINECWIKRNKAKAVFEIAPRSTKPARPDMKLAR